MVRTNIGLGALTLVILLVACASQGPTPQATGASETPSPDLARTLPSNCVNFDWGKNRARMREFATRFEQAEPALISSTRT